MYIRFKCRTPPCEMSGRGLDRGVARAVAAEVLHHIPQRVWEDERLDDRGPDHMKNVGTYKEGVRL